VSSQTYSFYEFRKSRRLPKIELPGLPEKGSTSVKKPNNINAPEVTEVGSRNSRRLVCKLLIVLDYKKESLGGIYNIRPAPFRGAGFGRFYGGPVAGGRLEMVSGRWEI